MSDQSARVYAYPNNTIAELFADLNPTGYTHLREDFVNQLHKDAAFAREWRKHYPELWEEEKQRLEASRV